MKFVTVYRERGELLVGDLDTLRVDVFVDVRLDVQPFASRGATDQVNHDLPADQGSPSPTGGSTPKPAEISEFPVLLSVPASSDRLGAVRRQGQDAGIGSGA